MYMEHPFFMFLDHTQRRTTVGRTPLDELKFTTIVTGHGNIKTYLYKYKITENPMCSCENGEQSVDHILFDCKLLENDRVRLNAAVLRSEY